MKFYYKRVFWVSFCFSMMAVEAFAQSAAAFRKAQYAYPRVQAARTSKATTVTQLFEVAGLNLREATVFLRAFKHEKIVELWAKDSTQKVFKFLKTYPICERSGTFGPKRTAGDDQTPEGFYVIDRFNPQSTYHLSMGLNYPNASDRILGKSPYGGDIFVHGKCVTIGCLPLTDSLIEELYWLSINSRDAHKSSIQIHVFPSRFDPESFNAMKQVYADENEGRQPNAQLLAFWKNIQKGYDYFQRNKTLPKISVLPSGVYQFD